MAQNLSKCFNWLLAPSALAEGTVGTEPALPLLCTCSLIPTTAEVYLHVQNNTAATGTTRTWGRPPVSHHIHDCYFARPCLYSSLKQTKRTGKVNWTPVMSPREDDDVCSTYDRESALFLTQESSSLVSLGWKPTITNNRWSFSSQFSGVSMGDGTWCQVLLWQQHGRCLS